MEWKEVFVFLRHLLLGICLSTFNLISSIINIFYLNKEGHKTYARMSLFLLWFPGMVTSVGFLVLYARGNRTVNSLVKWKLIVYPLLLVIFYPVIPIVLTAAFLYTKNERTYEKATIARFFAGFLDHGPHFVLRLVIVCLSGISQGGVYQRDDNIFILSMISSFGSFILCALWFNDRESSRLNWLFLSGPMFSAIFACRAFTLAVYLRETLNDPEMNESYTFLIITIMFLTNLALFKYFGQDWTRSAVFGIASLLLPAGYNNDKQYYQVPKQELIIHHEHCEIAPRLREDHEESQIQVQNMETETKDTELIPMKSGKFLLLHILINTFLMSTCALYIYFSKSLDTESDDALIIPQIFGVVPGLFFTIGRSFLMPDILPVYDENDTRAQQVCWACKKGTKLVLAIVFCILGFMSLMPALFWTFIYKWFTSSDIKDVLMSLNNGAPL